MATDPQIPDAPTPEPGAPAADPRAEDHGLEWPYGTSDSRDTRRDPEPASQTAPNHSLASPLQGEGGRLEGWPAWSAALAAAVAEAAACPADLMLYDEDFSAWPLGDKAVVESFERWVLQPGQAHLTLLAPSWGAFTRRHPRWLRWRAAWAHRVSCRQVMADELSSLQAPRPMLLVRGALGLQLLDQERGVGLWSRRPAAIAEWWQLGDAITQRSTEAMPVTTLGL